MKGAFWRIRYFSTSLTFLQNLGDTGTSISGRSSRILSRHSAAVWRLVNRVYSSFHSGIVRLRLPLFRSFSKREWLCGESPQGVACISGRLSFCFSISLREISLANGLNSFGCKEKKRGETISSVKTKSSGSAYQTGR